VEDLLSTLLSSKVSAAVTWIGTIAGLIGLGLTYWQARSAKIAAQKATKLVAELENKMALSRLAQATSNLDSLRVVIDGSHFAAAKTLVGPLRRSVSPVVQVLSNQGVDVLGKSATTRNLKVIEHQLSLAIRGDDSYKTEIVTKALAGLDEFFSDIEAKLLLNRAK
jgi:hypothetical protein